MKLLLAAPKICTPWSEGRKRFIRDLSSSLTRDHEVRIVTTVQQGQTTEFAVPFDAEPVKYGPSHFVKMHSMLRKRLRLFRPDLVCHLPLGSFHGRFKWPNIWSMWCVDRICRRAHVPCFTLMYSVTGIASVEILRPWVRHLMLNQFLSGDQERIRFGVRFDPPQSSLDDLLHAPGKRLLFMSGAWEKKQEIFQYVLSVRGLSTLLKAGRWLAPKGFRLTLAVPLLVDADFQKHLLALNDNHWPEGTLECIGEVSVPEIFSGKDFFVFPYAVDETQFIPTSVVEAMYYGLPSVLSDLSFLRKLSPAADTAFYFREGDAEVLAHTLLHVRRDDYLAVRENAARMIRLEMDIDGSCQDILDRFETLGS